MTVTLFSLIWLYCIGAGCTTYAFYRLNKDKRWFQRIVRKKLFLLVVFVFLPVLVSFCIFDKENYQ